ncbi:hypothetical protein WJX77_009115 [Trebouxia sp. C0004]
MTQKGKVLCTACLNPYKEILRRSLTSWNSAIAFSLGRPSSSSTLIFSSESMFTRQLHASVTRSWPPLGSMPGRLTANILSFHQLLCTRSVFAIIPLNRWSLDRMAKSARLYSSCYWYDPFGLLPSQEPCQESLDLPLVASGVKTKPGAVSLKASSFSFGRTQNVACLSLGSSRVWSKRTRHTSQSRFGLQQGQQWLYALPSRRRCKVIAHWRNTASITTQEKPLLGPNWTPLSNMLQLFMSDKAGCLSSGDRSTRKPPLPAARGSPCM